MSPLSVAAVILFSLSATSSAVLAGDEEPTWFRQPPIGEFHDYYSGVGHGDEVRQAFTAAVQNAEGQIGPHLGNLKIDVNSFLNALAKIDHTHVTSAESETAGEEIHTSGSWQVTTGVKVARVQVTHHPATGRCNVYVLLAVGRRERQAVHQPKGALWRSALVPGWGQVWKHQSGKGYTVFISEVVLLAGTLTTGIMSHKARDDADDTTIPANHAFYAERADNLFYVSLGMGIAAGALYVYNILDALLAERSDVIYEAVNGFPTISLRPSRMQLGLGYSF